jgi:hypothetical protein
MTEKPIHPPPPSHSSPPSGQQKAHVGATSSSHSLHKKRMDDVFISQESEELRSRLEQEFGSMRDAPALPAATYDAMFLNIQEHIQVDQQKPHWFEWRTPTRYLSLFALVVSLVCLILLFRPRADLQQYPLPRMLFIVTLFSLCLLIHLWYLVRPLHKPELPVWFTGRLIPWIGLSLPLFLAFWPLANASAAYTPATLAHMLKDTLVCLFIGSLFAVPFLWLSYRVSRYQSVGYVLLSGAAGGLFGNLLLQLFCPKSTLAHMVLGHGILGFFLLLALHVHQRRLQKLAVSSL